MSKEKHVLHQEFFINNWLDDPLFKDWLRNHEENTKSKCIVCAKAIFAVFSWKTSFNRSLQT